MSDGLRALCHKVLVLIFLIFHTEGITPNHWSPSVGETCHWEHIESGSTSEFELRRNLHPIVSSPYASVSAKFDGNSDDSPRQFCIRFRVHRISDVELTLVVNSNKSLVHESGKMQEKCFNYDSSNEVSFEARCPTFTQSFPPSPVLVIYGVYTKGLNVVHHSTTSTSLPDGPTTPDVGDIQYVGVVVGAICIALFTLFSCLTIISARRSNQRDARRRAIPSVSCQEEDDNRPDVVADNAPPSYDAVMACPDMYPPTPQDTPRGTPDTTPHLSLHRRTLLNQHTGSLPGSVSALPQLDRQSVTPTLCSDEWDDVPEDPPPPYPGLGNGEVPISIVDDTMDNTTTMNDTQGVMPGIENPRMSQTASEASSPNPNSPIDEQESPWVLNNLGHAHLRSRDSNPSNEGNTEQHPMRTRTPSSDSGQSDPNSQAESTSSFNNSVIDTTSESAQDRGAKPIAESTQQNCEIRVAVV